MKLLKSYSTCKALAKTLLFLQIPIAIMVLVAIYRGSSWKGALLSALFIYAYFALIFACLFRTSFFEWLHHFVSNLSFPILLGMVVFSTLYVSLFCFYISLNKTILFWDNGMYWYSALELNSNYSLGIRVVMANVYSSVLNSDYNMLPTMLISLPMMISNSYVSFVGWNLVLFQMPLSIVITWLCGLIRPCGRGDHEFDRTSSLRAWAYALLFAPLIVPILSGFIDIAVVLICVVIFAMIFDTDFFAFDAVSSSLFGLILGCTFLMRRYFVYLDIGMFSGFLMLSVGRVLHMPAGFKKRAIRRYACNAVIAILAMLTPLCVFFKQFIYRSFFNNYGTAYSAYVLYSNPWERLYSYLVNCGPVYIVLAVIGVISVLARQRQRLNLAALCVSGLISMAMFLRVQDFSIQHYYVIDIELFVLSYIGLEAIFVRCQRSYKTLGTFVINSLVALTLLNMTGVLSNASFSSDFFGTVWYRTTVREDLAELSRLNSDVERCVDESDASLYVNASSNVLNSSIVMRSYAPDRLYPPYKLETTCDIDLRDGFPTGFFEAEYVVVCDPVQTHVPNVDSQSVVLILNSLILDETNPIGSDYLRLSSYQLDNGVNAYLYKRVSPFDNEQIKYLYEIFANLYPDSSDLFQNRIAQYLK